MALAGGLGIAGFAAPALANNAGGNGHGNGGNSVSTPANSSGYNCNSNNSLPPSGGISDCPAGKVPGSEGKALHDTHGIPPGILGNTHAKGLCSDFATKGSLGNASDHQGRGKSQKGNPAHNCAGGFNIGTTTTVAGAVVSGVTTSVTPTVAPSASVLGETITAPAASTSAPAATTPAVAPTAVKKLPFTGPGHVGTLAGIGFSTLLLGSGLLLATRRQPLATISS